MTRSIYALLLLLVFAGCAGNPYKKFYTSKTDGKSVKEIDALQPSCESSQVFSGNDMNEDYLDMTENNYVMLGYSSFVGPLKGKDDVLLQARDLCAKTVLVYVKYRNTISGSTPITVQNPSQTSTTNFNGNVYGSRGGSAMYSGSSTTVVPGGYTTYDIPYSVERYDQTATYWVQVKRKPILGVRVRDLNSNERDTLERNTGITVIAVVKDTPAFRSNILRGDIITKIGDYSVTDSRGFNGELIKKYAGMEIPIEIIRNSERKVISVKLDKISSEN